MNQNQLCGLILIFTGVIFSVRQFVPYEGATLTTIELAVRQPNFFVQVLIGCTIGGVLGYVAANTWRIQFAGEKLATKRIVGVNAIVFVTLVIMISTRKNIIESSTDFEVATLPLKIVWVAAFFFLSGVLCMWKVAGTRPSARQASRLGKR